MVDLPKVLATNPIFAPLSPAQREQLASHCLSRTFEKGEFITLYGDVWPYFFVVGQGRVDGVKESREGRRLLMLTLQQSDVFWGLAFFEEGLPMPVTLEAHERTELHLWLRQDILPVLLANGHALWELSRLMVSRIQQASDIVEGLAFQPVAARLARFLLDQFGDIPDAPVSRDFTLDEMAAVVGTTREMVCRVLYRLADDDLIHITRTEFTLTNKTGLSHLAEQV